MSLCMRLSTSTLAESAMTSRRGLTEDAMWFAALRRKIIARESMEVLKLALFTLRADWY